MTVARRDTLIGVALLVLACVVPLIFPTRYIVTQVTLFFIWAVVVTQWNLVIGVGGIFSLAQMALFSVGAYGTAMLGYYFEWSLWLAMPVAAIITVIFSMTIGIACLRLRGAYVALLTLAIAQVLYITIINDTECFRTTSSGCMPLMGGVRGIPRFGDLGFRDIFGSKWTLADYYLALALLAVVTVFTIIIVRGPLGLAFRALRDNPGCAMSRGVSRFKYQLWVFALSAFFTGLAGALYAAHFRIIGPSVFSISLLLFLLSMIVVGGLGTIWGPILGAALLMVADEFLKDFSEYRAFGLGLILPVFVVLLPGGLVGLISKLTTRKPSG